MIFLLFSRSSSFSVAIAISHCKMHVHAKRWCFFQYTSSFFFSLCIDVSYIWVSMYYYSQILRHTRRKRKRHQCWIERKVATLNSSRVVQNVRKRQCVASAYKQCTAINHSLTTEVANIRNKHTNWKRKKKWNEIERVCEWSTIKTKNEKKTKSSTL